MGASILAVSYWPGARTYSGLTLAPEAAIAAASVAITPTSLAIRRAIALPALDCSVRLHAPAPLLDPRGDPCPMPRASHLGVPPAYQGQVRSGRRARPIRSATYSPNEWERTHEERREGNRL